MHISYFSRPFLSMPLSSAGYWGTQRNAKGGQSPLCAQGQIILHHSLENLQVVQRSLATYELTTKKVYSLVSCLCNRIVVKGAIWKICSWMSQCKGQKTLTGSFKALFLCNCLSLVLWSLHPINGSGHCTTVIINDKRCCGPLSDVKCWSCAFVALPL